MLFKAQGVMRQYDVGTRALGAWDLFTMVGHYLIGIADQSRRSWTETGYQKDKSTLNTKKNRLRMLKM